jgi:hypothetical protein
LKRSAGRHLKHNVSQGDDALKFFLPSRAALRRILTS